MSLFTKCILKDKDKKDGVRISVMSRHTQNDGVTPDARITIGSFDEHYPELAPSLVLIGDYYKRDLPWAQFEIRFRKQIRESASAQVILGEIAVMSLCENVTLLCIEDKHHFCHRRILTEECRILLPQIVVEHH